MDLCVGDSRRASEKSGRRTWLEGWRGLQNFAEAVDSANVVAQKAVGPRFCLVTPSKSPPKGKTLNNAIS